MKVSDTDKCSFCRNEIEKISHLFYDCTTTKLFWDCLEKKTMEKCPLYVNLKLSKQLILFGTETNVSTDNIFDFIIILGKQFISLCRFNKCLPDFKDFCRYVQRRYVIELYNAKINGTEQWFITQWSSYKYLIEDC